MNALNRPMTATVTRAVKAMTTRFERADPDRSMTLICVAWAVRPPPLPRCRRGREGPVGRLDREHVRGVVAALDDQRPPRGAERRRLVLRQVEHVADRRGRRGLVGDRDQQLGRELGEPLADARHVRGHDRDAAGERLEDRDRGAVGLGDRHDHVGEPEVVGHLGVRDAVEDGEPVGDADGPGELDEAGEVVRVRVQGAQREADVRGHLRDRADDVLVAVPREDDPRREDEPRRPDPDPLRGAPRPAAPG